MNIESLREHLAIKEMGAKLRYDADTNISDWYEFPDGLKIDIEDWNPPENIEQAEGCIETFEWYSICKNDDSYAEPGKPYSCEVAQEVEVNKSKTMAMSLAAAKATGWKE